MTLSWLSLIFIFISSAAPVCSQKFDFPRLSLHSEKALGHLERRVLVSVTNDFKTFFFNQSLDHFNYRPESYTNFTQRYLINSKYWGGADSGAPIFIYLGAEEPIDDDLSAIGFLTENAAEFKALLVYIEHRYYGKSIPLGMSLEDALKDPNIRGYFSSSQALADYAAIIRHMKEELKARDCPVIVVGGSYGGMLAAWFRLKYPHLAIGALASSAPILYFDGITPQDGYFSVVTKDFKEASKTCYQTISDSWEEIDRVASEPDGLSRLSKIFKTSRPLENGDDLKKSLKLLYAKVAQYDHPPRYPVEVMCKGIDGANTSGNGILEKIFAGVVAYYGSSRCYIFPPTRTIPSQTDLGYKWQAVVSSVPNVAAISRIFRVPENFYIIYPDQDGRIECADPIDNCFSQLSCELVMGVGITQNPMFQADPFNLSKFIDRCNRSYGVVPRPLWITTYYGGHDIEQVLRRFGSNIIFSNGLRDPYSSGGVLKNISNTIVAIHTQKGSHCLDILSALPDDPCWLVRQRKMEVEIIKGWISKYYADLLALKQ